MRKLFERTVRTAVTMKLVDLAVQAVDGTKVSANASVYRTHNAEELRKFTEPGRGGDNVTLKPRTKQGKIRPPSICPGSWPTRRC